MSVNIMRKCKTCTQNGYLCCALCAVLCCAVCCCVLQTYKMHLRNKTRHKERLSSVVCWINIIVDKVVVRQVHRVVIFICTCFCCFMRLRQIFERQLLYVIAAIINNEMHSVFESRKHLRHQSWFSVYLADGITNGLL